MFSVAVTTIVAVLFELTLHWFPWRLYMRRDLTKQETYTLGVLGFALPLTALWVWLDLWAAIASMWIVIISVGFSVLLAYRADALRTHIAQGEEAMERLNETGQTRSTPD